MDNFVTNTLEDKKILTIAFNKVGIQAAFNFYNILQKNNCLENNNMEFFLVIKNSYKKELETSAKFSEIKKKYYSSFDNFLKEHWKNKKNIFLFFSSTGIIIRKIAPLLKSKYEDPAVLATDFSLKYFIPLLSGHVGGAVQVANFFVSLVPSSHCILTGASDQLNFTAIDILVRRWQVEMENTNLYAHLANHLIDKQKIFLYAPNVLQNFFKSQAQELSKLVSFKENLTENRISKKNISKSFCFTWKMNQSPTIFTIRINNIFLGIGTNRNIPLENIEKAFFSFLEENEISLIQIRTVASVDFKKNEIELLNFCKKNNLAIQFFSKEEINKIEKNLSSSAAQRLLGIKGVAEPCAILSSYNKTLLIPKKVYKGVTIAAAF